MHVDAEALRESSDSGQSVLSNGPRVTAETSRRLACDASRVIMLHDAEGRTIGVTRRTRTVPPAIRRALDHRDRGCRFPGCGLRLCDAHHVKHWADGGATRLQNLMLLCRRHHRAVYEEGFRIVVSEDGELRFHRPDGRALDAAPLAPRLPEDPPANLASAHCALGLEIDESTAMSGWMGERLDLDYAVLTLRGPRTIDRAKSRAFDRLRHGP
ncbi:MAG: HNH endonuclease [Longimicrobiales bacterium]